MSVNGTHIIFTSYWHIIRCLCLCSIIAPLLMAKIGGRSAKTKLCAVVGSVTNTLICDIAYLFIMFINIC
jgi:uncharacterized membrane protein